MSKVEEIDVYISNDGKHAKIFFATDGQYTVFHVDKTGIITIIRELLKAAEKMSDTRVEHREKQ